MSFTTAKRIYDEAPAPFRKGVAIRLALSRLTGEAAIIKAVCDERNGKPLIGHF